ncbi:MAG TPA: hypothetical protein VKE22_26065 [Haliangiales bacterium]|nr:hypothetical protein [Haliangiales bacterium]
MLDTLTSLQRKLLMKLVCGCVWADLEVTPAEREHVGKLIVRLGLTPAEAAEVRGWLDAPPRTDDVDPMRVPVEHRQMLLATLREVATVDGHVCDEEAELIALLEQLLA